MLVVRNGKPVFRQGYGVTDLRSLHPIDPKTNFRLASFTKQFTAMCIMLLAHEGKLGFDDHLTQIFPEFPAYGKSITIRNLLNHTSGLPDYEDILMKQYPNTPPEKIPQILDAGVLKLMERQTATKFPPGSKWEYSNSGYAVLAMIVEQVSGKPFGQFLHDRIFAPLKMQNTLAYEKGKNEVPNRAYGYSKTTQVCSRLIRARRPQCWATAVSIRLLMTSRNGIAPCASIPCSVKPKCVLHSPRFKWPMAFLLSEGHNVSYGFGWFLDPYKGHRRMWHDGETIGFRTTIQRFPYDNLTVIVLANRTDVDPEQLALKVADLYLEKKP